jgi:hypothetical protein
VVAVELVVMVVMEDQVEDLLLLTILLVQELRVKAIMAVAVQEHGVALLLIAVAVVVLVQLVVLVVELVVLVQQIQLQDLLSLILGEGMGLLDKVLKWEQLELLIQVMVVEVAVVLEALTSADLEDQA